jgi:cyclopropane fatty-acyl-phospholipid synthase-like methyltransferase
MIYEDPKRIVRQGYDRIVRQFEEWAQQVRREERERYTYLLQQRVPAGARVLELGCGAGLPTTRELAEHYAVTAVDLSGGQLALARQNVPRASFVQADMACLGLAPARFDAVAAFYALIHVPREEQPALLRQIAAWLCAGGWLVATMGVHDDEAGYEEDWLGAPMYWSSYDAVTNRRLVAEAGLRIVQASEETALEFGQPVTFLWVMAQKPGGEG